MAIVTKLTCTTVGVIVPVFVVAARNIRFFIFAKQCIDIFLSSYLKAKQNFCTLEMKLLMPNIFSVSGKK